MARQTNPKSSLGAAIVRMLRDSSPTPELDGWIERTVREKQEIASLIAGLTKVKNPPKTQPKLHLRYEAPTHQFGTQPVDPLSKVTGLDKLLGFAMPRAPRSIAKLKPEDERKAELLEILWADPKLWELVAGNKPLGQIVDYCRQHYGFEFPPLPPVVWRQMVWRPQKRATLFQVSGVRFARGRDLNTFLELEYLEEPGLSHLHRLASQKLNARALAYLRQAVQKLAQDLAWCERHPGVIPPPLAPTLPHRTPDINRARKVEKMVARLLKDPDLSDYQLGGGDDAKRKMAAEARTLVELREGEVVKRYSENRGSRIIGRKPRRVSKITIRG
jgi:hypothetical protein